MKIDWIEPGALAANGIPIGVKDLESLHEQGIRAIVTLTEKPLTTQHEVTPELLARLQITALHVPVVDQHPPDAQQVTQVREFIDQMRQMGKPVFVHCAAGIGRTGTMLHAYYIAKGLSLEDAKQKVKMGRRSSAFLMLTASQQAFLQQMAGEIITRKKVSSFPTTRFLNRDGFHMQFTVHDDGSVEAEIMLDESMQSAPTVVHGGAISSILDEAMTVAAFEAQRMGVTANLNVNFRAPVPIDTVITVTAAVERIEGKKTYAKSELRLPDGTVAAEAQGLFIFSQVMNDGLRALLGL
ncbi:MAG: dual specificity protein phosphatase family protein [Anaerolineae bacterium]